MELARDREAVARLHLVGKTQKEIADEVGIAQGTVSKDLAAVRKKWEERAADFIENQIFEDLNQVNIAQREYWDAWERSKGMREIIVSEGHTRPAAPGKDGQSGAERKFLKKVVKKEKMIGEKAFLDGFVSCIKERQRILGIKPPEKIAFTSPDGKEEAAPGAATVLDIANLIRQIESQNENRN